MKFLFKCAAASLGLPLSLLLTGCGSTIVPGSGLAPLSETVGTPNAITRLPAYVPPPTYKSISSIPASAATTANSGIVKWGIFSFTNHEWQAVGIDRYSQVVFTVAEKVNADSSVSLRTSDGTYVNLPNAGNSIVYYLKARSPATWIDQDFVNDTGAHPAGPINPPGGGGPVAMIAGGGVDTPACLEGIAKFGKDMGTIMDAFKEPSHLLALPADIWEFVQDDLATRNACGAQGTYIMPDQAGAGAGGTNLLCQIDGATIDCSLMIPFLF